MTENVSSISEICDSETCEKMPLIDDKFICKFTNPLFDENAPDPYKQSIVIEYNDGIAIVDIQDGYSEDIIIIGDDSGINIDTDSNGHNIKLSKIFKSIRNICKCV